MPIAYHYLTKKYRIQMRITSIESSGVDWIEERTSATVCESKARWHRMTRGAVGLGRVQGATYLYFFEDRRPAFRVRRGRPNGEWEAASNSNWRKINATAGQWSSGEPLSQC